MFPAREVRATLLDGFECVCSRCSSNTARGVRVALSKGLDTGVSRGSIRADQGFRFGRIERFDTDGSIGGAYASIIAHPQLIQTIIAVYDVLVDSFDDEHLYCTNAYFLLRGIMHINSSKS